MSSASKKPLGLSKRRANLQKLVMGTQFVIYSRWIVATIIKNLIE